MPTASLPSVYPEGGPGRHLRARLGSGDLLLGGMVAEYLRPSIMKLYKQAGFDFAYIEYEHAYFEPAGLADSVLSARDTGLPVIAKTPQLDRAEVAKLLETGIVGIQLPRTETRGQVETLRSYIKFPPGGTRAVAPGYGSSDYAQPSDWSAWMKDQDQETLLVVHIETKLGYTNAEEIISTPGVDMVYVGPGDFSIEMGRPGDYDHPDVAGPMADILELCLRYDVPFGTTPSGSEVARDWADKGARFFETADEFEFILTAATKMVADYRGRA